jgi:hypothetical protein
MLGDVETREANLENLAENILKIFFVRRDLYSRQFDDGRYICVHKPLKTWHIVKHLEGEITLGTYLLNQDNQAHFIVFDADDSRRLVSLVHMAAQLEISGVPTYLEESRRGGHLWLFFDRLVSGHEARPLGDRLKESFQIVEIELFPKQTHLKSGPGSLIRLPFGIHRQSGERYEFINRQGNSLAPTMVDQINVLGKPKTVPLGDLKDFMNRYTHPIERTDLKPSEELHETPSKRTKQAVSVFDFVSQYVELTPDGRGLCPFHDDQHSSFSVNIEKNYWNCFVGCGGGSIIDFWMKRQDCDFTTAIRELAQILL